MDLKKVNVTEADTQKRFFDIKNEKKKAQEMRKKAIERFGETRKRKGQDESDTGDKKQSRRCSSEVVGFLREKLGEDRKFKSEDFLGDSNQSQHNQLKIQNQQM